MIIISVGLLYTFSTVIVSMIEIRRRLFLIPRNQLPPVSILKPLKGIDDQLERNLQSFFTLDYPKHELLFGLSDPKDPAITIVKKLQARYPQVSSRLVIDPRRVGLNPKVNNLENLYTQTRYNLLLISDSNVRVENQYVYHMVSEYLKPGVGLVTSIFRGSFAQSIGSIFENLHLNTYIAPNVMTIKKLFCKSITIGKSMLFNKEVIDRIKGFSIFGEFLAEDHMLGIHIKNAGLKISQSNYIIDNVNINWSVDKFINRHMRWAKMRRTINIGHYLAEPLSNPILIAFVLMLVRLDIIGIILFSLITFTKIIPDMINARLIKSDLKWYHGLLIPLKDLLIGFIWFVPFVNRKINWRGNNFRISKGTRLLPIPG
jgi:ceramide glucosyltransferase